MKIHVLQGTARKDRHGSRSGEIEPGGGFPVCPDYLSDFAKGEWMRMSKISKWAAAITAADATELEVYCQLKGLWIDSCNPENEPMSEGLIRQMRSAAAKLGLTPSDRVKIRVPEPEAKPMNKFAGIG
jgi:phage terminase small subunit